MKQRVWGIVSIIMVLLLGVTIAAHAAVTVYLKDGTRLEVDRIVRVGNSVALFLDISRIDTTRTTIEKTAIDEIMKTESTPIQGLAVTNVQFSPSADNTEIIATGTVENHSQRQVKNIHVTVTLMDKQGQVLLVIHGYPYPETLEPGQSGTYAFRARKPEGFGKASVDVKAEAQ